MIGAGFVAKQVQSVSVLGNAGTGKPGIVALTSHLFNAKTLESLMDRLSRVGNEIPIPGHGPFSAKCYGFSGGKLHFTGIPGYPNKFELRRSPANPAAPEWHVLSRQPGQYPPEQHDGIRQHPPEIQHAATSRPRWIQSGQPLVAPNDRHLRGQRFHELSAT